MRPRRSQRSKRPSTQALEALISFSPQRPRRQSAALDGGSASPAHQPSLLPEAMASPSSTTTRGNAHAYCCNSSYAGINDAGVASISSFRRSYQEAAATSWRSNISASTGLKPCFNSSTCPARWIKSQHRVPLLFQLHQLSCHLLCNKSLCSPLRCSSRNPLPFQIPWRCQRYTMGSRQSWPPCQVSRVCSLGLSVPRMFSYLSIYQLTRGYQQNCESKSYKMNLLISAPFLLIQLLRTSFT